MRKDNMKAAFMLGMSAAKEGTPLAANPCEPQSQSFESWADGWKMAIALAELETKQTEEGP